MAQVVSRYLGLRTPSKGSIDWYDDIVYSFKIIDDIAKVYYNDTEPGGNSIVYCMLSNGQRIPAITVGSEGLEPTVAVDNITVAENKVEVVTDTPPAYEETASTEKYLLITDSEGEQWVAPLFKRIT